MQDLSGVLSKRLHLAQVWPLVAVGLLGLVLAAAAWIAVSVWEERLAKARFNDVAGDYQVALQTGLDRYVDEIRAVRALYDASQSVNFREFDLFTSQILGRNRDAGDARADHSDPIVRIRWSPLVADSERVAFEHAQQVSGHKDFAITQWTLAAPIKAGRPRAEYFPVLFSTDHDTDPTVVGMDLNSEPVRRDTIRRAIATGNMATAQDVMLREPGGNNVRGFIVVLPVYAHSSAQGAGAKPNDLLGVLSASFETEPPMDAILDKVGLPPTVAVYLFAANAGERWAPLFSRSESQAWLALDKEKVQEQPIGHRGSWSAIPGGSSSSCPSRAPWSAITALGSSSA
jgi:CHASE1-domain containing sensor protein